MKLLSPRLYIDAKALPDLVQWYHSRLSMEKVREYKTATEYIVWLGFPNQPQSSILEFRCIHPEVSSGCDRNAGYCSRPSVDTYWKIGLALADVDTARNQLIQNGVEVSQPMQFRDIGYLCHLQDPFGYGIELLQHTFKANFSRELISSQLDTDLQLGQESLIGQITLRVSDIKKSLTFYGDTLGMKLLSRQ